MSESQQYDAVIIGSGQGGNPLAKALAAAGRKTAVIEREHAGGTCVNEGCTPTKTMVASARAAYIARRAADYGVETGPVSVDMSVVRGRKRDIVDKFRGGNEKGLESADNLDLIMGEARFIGPKELEIQLNDGGTLEIAAENIFINVGARPGEVPVDGLGAVPYLDSTSIMELDEVPEHLIVLGGGYIGLEFSQMFRRFGSEVTIVQRGPQLLAREDSDIAEAVADILDDDGVEVLLQTEASSVEQDDNGKIHLTVNAPDGERTIEGSHLLVAAGRPPNTDLLNLGAAGIETDKRGFVTVNGKLETNVAGVYAIGDVKGGPAFTHISYDDYRVLKTNLLDGGDASVADRVVAYTVFMDPQLGRVGLSETEAEERGRTVKVVKMPMTSVARALEYDESRGLMKALVDAETGEVLGAAVLGMEGGEIMSMIHIAILGKLPYTVLRDGAFAHPTLAESFNSLFAMVEE
ncbi:MAG: mercuric reductase [Rubrobacter sp.]|nr:mercuric reductase [Rubrobacter sp.]